MIAVWLPVTLTTLASHSRDTPPAVIGLAVRILYELGDVVAQPGIRWHKSSLTLRWVFCTHILEVEPLPENKIIYRRSLLEAGVERNAEEGLDCLCAACAHKGRLLGHVSWLMHTAPLDGGRKTEEVSNGR